MSPEAVDQRLRDVAQLWKLGMSIRNAEYLGTVEELMPEQSGSNVHVRDEKV